MIGTGHSASVTVGGAAVGFVRTVGAWELTLPQVQASHLGTTGPAHDYVPADLADMGEFTLNCLFDTEQASLLAVGGTPVAIVYTLKLLPGETTPANYTGTGWISRRTSPNSESNVVMEHEYNIQWDAEPAFTAATIV